MYTIECRYLLDKDDTSLFPMISVPSEDPLFSTKKCAAEQEHQTCSFKSDTIIQMNILLLRRLPLYIAFRPKQSSEELL